MTQDWERRLADIKKRRTRLGMTQIELADAAGITESTIQNLEGVRTYTSEPRSLKGVEAALAKLEDAADAKSAADETAAPIERPTATGMPLRVQHELAGEVVDTEVIELSRGGMRMVVVVTRDPDDTATDDEMRADFAEWSRVQRQLRNIASGDPK